MENPYIDYYSKQVGSGISGFAGDRYHRGNGFFGKILKKLSPALKYIGRQGWEAFKTMGSDVMNGESLENAGKNNLIKTARTVMNDANDRIEKFKKQSGNGYKRRTKRKVSRKKRAKKVYKQKKVKKVKKKVKKKRKTSKKTLINSYL